MKTEVTFKETKKGTKVFMKGKLAFYSIPIGIKKVQLGTIKYSNKYKEFYLNFDNPYMNFRAIDENVIFKVNKMIEAKKKTDKIKCSSLSTHNFKNLRANTKCSWCNKSIKELKEEI